MPKTLAELVNTIADPGDARAVRDIIENFGDVCPDDAIRQNQLDRDYTYEEFESNPVTALIAGGATGGTAGNENAMAFEDNVFEYHILGTQTITAPSLCATGLDLEMDAYDNDGVEVTQGITAKSRSAFVVGTSPPFFISVKFSIEDVSETDDCAVGFRLAEAYQANIDDYNTWCAFNVQAGTINIETELDNAAGATTDTTETWTGGATKTLTVLVDANGVVTFEIDGVAPSTTAAFTITDGDTVIPFFYFLHLNTSANSVILQSWECGLQSARV